MDKMKLRPEELAVTSFEATPAEAIADAAYTQKVGCPTPYTVCLPYC